MDADFLKTVCNVAKMGDILCDTIEGKNAWKKRMLGTINGIDFPTDWDKLSETEKEKRLDSAINMNLQT